MPVFHSHLLFAILLTLSALASAVCGWMVWQRREALGAHPLALILLSAVVWCSTYALHWLSASPAAQAFWLDATYLGVVSSPAALLWFALRFTGRAAWLKGWKTWLLAVVPALTLVILFTDPLHGLFYGQARPAGLSKIFGGGPWFWINAAYLYLQVITGVVLLGQHTRQVTSPLARRQTRVIWIGVLFPLIGSLLGFTNLNPFSGLDLTPIAYTLTSLVLYYGLIRYGLLDLVPIGRDVLVEQMEEGMLLLDGHARLIDLNPAARRAFGLDGRAVIGLDAPAALAEQPVLARLLRQPAELSDELWLEGEPAVCLALRITRLEESSRGPGGWLVMVTDVTARVIAEQALRDQLEQNRALQASLREQALRDPLTNLYNRRYLQETLPRELSKSEREGTPLALAILDLDHFKDLNDTFGHLAGDAVLCLLAEILTGSTRQGDIVCRFGGEELVVVMPGAGAQTAAERTETWRAMFAATTIFDAGQPVRSTLSAGVACFPENGRDFETLLRAADAALYHAKTAGRNRVFSCSGAFRTEKLSPAESDTPQAAD